MYTARGSDAWAHNKPHTGLSIGFSRFRGGSSRPDAVSSVCFPRPGRAAGNDAGIADCRRDGPRSRL